MDIWFFFWVTIMLGLIIATLVAALREKKARATAVAQMQPQPLGDGSAQADPMMAGAEEGFGAPAGDGFGDAADPMAGFDFENK